MQKMIHNKIFVSLCIASILILFPSCANSENHGSEYMVEVVTYSLRTETVRGAHRLKVVSYDSRIDSLQTITRDIENSILPIFCELVDSKEPSGFMDQTRPYPIMTNKSISELIGSYLPAGGQIGPRLGSCYADEGVRFQSMVYNAIRIIPRVDDVSTSEMLFQFYCLFNELTHEVIFVDSIFSPKRHGPSRRFDRGFFSSNGRYFYYRKHGLVKRFDIETRSINVISQGSVPVIPWNSEGIAVYSEEESLFKLLSEDGSVKSTVKLKIIPPIRSVFAIDSTTFVCASSAPMKEWYSPAQEVFIIDFAKGETRKLIERTTVLQIWDAKRVN